MPKMEQRVELSPACSLTQAAPDSDINEHKAHRFKIKQRSHGKRKLVKNVQLWKK